MRVLFVLDSLSGGGAERSTAVLVPALIERGIDVSFAVMRASPTSVEERSLVAMQVPITVISAGVKGIVALRRKIRAERPDVVHTALFDADLLGRCAGWRTPAKIVSSLVNTPYDRQRLSDPNVNRFKLHTARLLDASTARLSTSALHAVTEGVAVANATALRYPRERIFVAERGRGRDDLGLASAQRHAATRTRLGIADDVPLIVTAGRQEYQKAHADLVAAVAALRSLGHGQAHVLIAGRPGNASEALRRAIAEHEAAGFVDVLGDRDDVADLIVAADLFCLSSRWEGTAGAALEAMALDCPIVCTDVDGLRGVLVDGINCLLRRAGDPHGLAEAMAATFDDAESTATRVRQARREFDTRFTLDAAAERMVALYAKVVQA